MAFVFIFRGLISLLLLNYNIYLNDVKFIFILIIVSLISQKCLQSNIISSCSVYFSGQVINRYVLVDFQTIL